MPLDIIATPVKNDLRLDNMQGNYQFNTRYLLCSCGKFRPSAELPVIIIHATFVRTSVCNRLLSHYTDLCV
jgi:hypothetical protein